MSVKGVVHVVDDTPANLALLEGMLTAQGYAVRAFPRGRLALAAAQAAPPDIILLDINMPELNGYEVCAQLKAHPATVDIPVLFISALNETVDKVKAFAAGGVDYVTKPFQFEEVQARLETHLKLHRLQREVVSQYHDLRRLESLRDTLVHMVVHDLRSPLTSLLAYFELVEMLPRDDPATTLDKLDYYGRAAQESTQRVLDMVNSVLDVNSLEAGELKLERASCDLCALVTSAVDALTMVRGHRWLDTQVPPEPLWLEADGDMLRRVLQNLLGNAIKFTPKTEGIIRVKVLPLEARVRVEVIDNGPGIPPEYRERVFDKFGQVDENRAEGVRSTGLGLTFCKLAVEAHGGEIGVTEAPGGGSLFWFELPPACGAA